LNDFFLHPQSLSVVPFIGLVDHTTFVVIGICLCPRNGEAKNRQNREFEKMNLRCLKTLQSFWMTKIYRIYFDLREIAFLRAASNGEIDEFLTKLSGQTLISLTFALFID
jgi:hypothetical protein